MGVIGRAALAGNRGHVDDYTGLRADHGGQYGARTVEGSIEIGAQHTIPLFVAHR